MSAFDRGQLGVWHTSIYSFKPWDGNASSGLKALGVRQVFCDPDEVNPEQPTITVNGKQQPNYMLTPAAMQNIRNVGLVPQISTVRGTHIDDGKQVAIELDAHIKRLSHTGAVMSDVERGSDVQTAQTAIDFIKQFRLLHPTFIYALCVAGRKAGILGQPIVQADGSSVSVLDLMRNDPYAHLRVEQTLGNMQGEVLLEEERYQYVTLRNFPEARLSFSYAVVNYKDTIILPGFFNGQLETPITRGDIFNSNKLRQVGLI